ncbi:hypothetical protein JCGZ_17121 [Jatropha curcas]|uniref:Uncharacterized protein n=1 Tax=Jatropha curcas TaxID=180498 RepID=A0A067KE40_JATCU|nr:hypothetical protein JCGZ_17121 [Jatropha curcas]
MRCATQVTSEVCHFGWLQRMNGCDTSIDPFSEKWNEMRHTGGFGVCHFGRLQQINGCDTSIDPVGETRNEMPHTRSFQDVPLLTASIDEWG